MRLISQRIASLIKDPPTARLTLTDELKQIGMNFLQDDKVLVKLLLADDGSKIITVEALPKELM